MRYLALLPLVIVIVADSTWGQAGAPATEVNTERRSEDAPEPPDKVDVQPIARDDEIAARLQDIFDATEWFTNPNVEVRDGVAFLSGEASKVDYQMWAGDLARNTQDVAAVVNRMSVRQRSMWDMSPALAELKKLTAKTIQTVPLVLFGLVIIASTWLFARGIRCFAEWFLQRRVSNRLLRSVASQAAMIPILLIGVYIVLRVSGLTQLALTVLGGTGIAGLIIGIAFRDIAENFLASILISIQNPFRTGDLIKVGDHDGFVQRVSTRGTLLMTHEGNHVQLPNSLIYKSTVVNFTANPNRRVEFFVGIGYDDSTTKAQDVIKKVLDTHPSVLSDPDSRVILEELGAATVKLRVFVWLDASRHSPDAVRSSVMRIVKQSLLREGISMPDEAREVIFPNQVPVRLLEGPDSVTTEASRTDNKDELGRQESPTKVEQLEDVVSAGEGSLQSDMEEIQRQADKSWAPEEGTNLLSEDKPMAEAAP